MKRLALAVALLLLATVPYWVGNSYYINVATQILIYAVLALGLNVLVGYAGLVELRMPRVTGSRWGTNITATSRPSAVPISCSISGTWR